MQLKRCGSCDQNNGMAYMDITVKGYVLLLFRNGIAQSTVTTSVLKKVNPLLKRKTTIQLLMEGKTMKLRNIPHLHTLLQTLTLPVLDTATYWMQMT